jgi:hypothetical protein
MVGFLRESIHRILTALLRANQIFKKEFLNQCIFLKKKSYTEYPYNSVLQKKTKVNFSKIIIGH